MSESSKLYAGGGCPCGAVRYVAEGEPKVGQDDAHTVHAGSLDDPTLFQPTVAIFAPDCPDWVVIPLGLTTFETLHG